VSEVRINAEPRTEFGKGGARRTRRAGNVPAVLYGHGEAPVHIALPAREFAAIIRHSGMTQVLNIDISDGTKALALPKAIQRDPVRDTYDHVDLLVVRAGERITVDVPVVLVGEAARDTLVNHDQQTISIVADATMLPELIIAIVNNSPSAAEMDAEGESAEAEVTTDEAAAAEGDAA